MTRIELLVLIGLAIALICTGLTVLFGPYALVGTGSVLLAVAFFINLKEG